MGVIDLGLMQEMAANQDMTIASFVDTPANRTLKTAMMLKVGYNYVTQFHDLHILL
jgi:hypothetical protein